jgi:hypothetical protein
LPSVSIKTSEASNDIQESLPPTPSFTNQERLALLFPHTNVYLKDLDRLVYGNELNWPDMRYMNEGAYLLGRTIIPIEIRIVPAGNTVKGYNPVTEELSEAIEYIKHVIGNGFRPPTLEVVFIPPGGSLVMVQIDVQASGSDPSFSCGQDYEGPRGDAFRISYPGLGEHENAYQPEYGNIYSVAYTLGDFNSPFINCLDDGWLYFYLPTLDVDPSLLWLEFIQTVDKKDTVTGERYSDTILSFWTLTDRPQ